MQQPDSQPDPQPERRLQLGKFADRIVATLRAAGAYEKLTA